MCRLSMVNCPLCTFQACSVSTILSHLRTVHSNDSNFSVACGLGGCATTSKTFSALYSHIYRRHPDVIKKRPGKESSAEGQPMSTAEIEDDIAVEEIPDIRYLIGSDLDHIRRSSALFLLKLKEKRRLTQVAIDDVVEGCQGLFSQTIDRVKASVKAKLAESGVDLSEIDGLDEAFHHVVDPFEGIESCHLQERYFREKIGLIEPTEIKIGEPEYRPQFSGSKRRLVERYDSFQYVPLLPFLSKLLCDDTLIDQIDTCQKRIHTDGQIEDFCDGTIFASHPLFSQDPYALQIIAYYDEVEICNPLGTHVKRHKLGIVFYTLGNIAPQYRSQLKAINLAIIATAPVIEKHGIDAVLRPFIEDLNTLATSGISIQVRGVPRTFKGALLAFLADNLASNELGGFKKSFSFAFRSCRTCLVTNDALSTAFVSDTFEQRTESNHRSQCALLHGPAGAHYSKTYGINRQSSLLDIVGYSMFGGGLPHDAMHDILEGLAPLEIKLLLKEFISQKLFSLQEYNSRLLNFNFGYSDTDKPVPILSRNLQPDNSLRSSASQMLTLVRILPFLIGDKIPEESEHWFCFILLKKIVDIVLCPVVSENQCSTLKILINEHHCKFVQLYGVSFYIPKMHFLLHYPDQIQSVAPMVRTWTIRHEAKLNFFKQASHLTNFKNVAFALANRHQRWISYELASGNLIKSTFQCGPPTHGTGITQVHQEPKNIQENLVKLFSDLDSDTTVFRAKWVSKNGILYQCNNAHVIIDTDGLDPVFGRIDEVLVVGGDQIVFVVSLCKTEYFDGHYHSYVINVTSHRSLLSTLKDHNVYHGHTLLDGFIYISLKYCVA